MSAICFPKAIYHILLVSIVINKLLEKNSNPPLFDEVIASPTLKMFERKQHQSWLWCQPDASVNRDTFKCPRGLK